MKFAHVRVSGHFTFAEQISLRTCSMAGTQYKSVAFCKGFCRTFSQDARIAPRGYSYLKWMSQAFKLCEEIDDRLSWVEALEQAKRTECQFGLCCKSCVTLTTSFKAFPGLGFLHLWNEGYGLSLKMFCILGGRLPCWLFKNSFHSEKMCVM